MTSVYQSNDATAAMDGGNDVNRPSNNSASSSNLDVDWIYRGKKKSKRSNSSTSKEKPKNSSIQNQSPINGSLANSNVATPTVSNDVGNGGGQKLNPGSASIDHIDNKSNTTTTTPQQSIQSQQHPEAAPQQSHRSLLSQQLKTRPRSASDSSKTKPPSVRKPTLNVSNSLKRSNSLNESQKSNQSTSSSQPQTAPQPQPKPKKSIFSAFSKLKGSRSSSNPTPVTAPVSAPISQSQQHQQQQQQQQSQTQQSQTQQHYSQSPPPEPMSIPNTPKSSVPSTPKSLPASVDSMSPTSGLLLGSLAQQDQKSNPSQSPQERIILNKNPNRSQLPIKNLSNIRLRRVTFALDKLPDDPPQQIPSRRPKKGNVIVVEDLVSGPSKLNVGITNESQTESKKYDDKELKMVMESQRKALEEAEKHAQEAHFAAKRIANEVKLYKQNNNKKSPIEKQQEEDEDAVDVGVSNLEIDKPIHLHEHHYEEEEHQIDEDIPLELIYTRCCHLREILPIPATLKQLKNKHSPLTTLKMLNPKPTLIDVYSFSDFIAIVPIKNIIFDNVTMNTEMFKVVLSSLINSTTIEKLSLKNVPIDEIGWKYLCKFLSRNKNISKLDISQMKVKTDLPLSQHRSEMDWSLFINTLSLRGGLSELILNGCKLSTLDFCRLIDEGISISTKRLGLVSMGLDFDQIKKLSSWITAEGSTCEGIDLGFNDLSIDNNLKPIVKKLANNKNPKLAHISFNSTNLSNVEDSALLIRSLSNLENLNFLDLSNLKLIFPGIMPYLNKYLPRFPNLKRLHLDSNELSTKSFSILSGIIPKCVKLIHLSIMNQSTISYAAAATLYSAIKSSKTILNLDIDYDLIDEKISSRIAVCLMRNMESSMNGDSYHHLDSYDDILFDGTLIAETAGKLLEKFNTHEIENDEFSKKFLKKKFLNKINESRGNINKTIDELLTKQDQKLLSLQEKEDLLRFYFLDDSLLKILDIFQNLNDEPSQQSDVQPHQMATELTEGKETAIDVATGKPILLRSVSQTSMQAKKQEEEEGEFHRWGFFVQQQRQLYPNDKLEHHPPQPQSPSPQQYRIPQSPQQQKQQQVSQQQQQQQQYPTSIPAPQITAPNQQDLSTWAKLPSGEELRDAVIKAKGINSINDLIENVNGHRFNLDKIYPTIQESKESSGGYFPVIGSNTNGTATATGTGSTTGSGINSGIGSGATTGGDISEDSEDYQEVDEVYDKLLNSLQKVRSNK